MTGIAAGGPVEREVLWWSRWGSALLRVAGVVCASVLGLLMAPANVALTVGVVVALDTWSLVYLRYAFRSAGRWLLYTDTCVLGAVFLTQGWTVSPEAFHLGTSWLVFAVSVVVVANQWHLLRDCVVSTIAVATAYVVGWPMSGASEMWVVAWLLALATLSRTFYLLVRQGARAADRIGAERERARRDAEVAAARRADERAQLATLHDTAAATMLAIATGAVRQREPWLAEQAARDLDVLAGNSSPPHSIVDLVYLLGDVILRSPVTVDLLVPDRLPVPARAAVAITRSVAEALTNVARHAEVGTASLFLERWRGVVVAEVVDTGRGFEPDQVSPHRRGISLSIVDRMMRVGGRAFVTSHPGHGTQVRLEWPDD